jgi:hypothetical protein
MVLMRVSTFVYFVKIIFIRVFLKFPFANQAVIIKRCIGLVYRVGGDIIATAIN